MATEAKQRTRRSSFASAAQVTTRCATCAPGLLFACLLVCTSSSVTAQIIGIPSSAESVATANVPSTASSQRAVVSQPTFPAAVSDRYDTSQARAQRLLNDARQWARFENFAVARRLAQRAAAMRVDWPPDTLTPQQFISQLDRWECAAAGNFDHLQPHARDARQPSDPSAPVADPIDRSRTSAWQANHSPTQTPTARTASYQAAELAIPPNRVAWPSGDSRQDIKLHDYSATPDSATPDSATPDSATADSELPQHTEWPRPLANAIQTAVPLEAPSPLVREDMATTAPTVPTTTASAPVADEYANSAMPATPPARPAPSYPALPLELPPSNPSELLPPAPSIHPRFLAPQSAQRDAEPHVRQAVRRPHTPSPATAPQELGVLTLPLVFYLLGLVMCPLLAFAGILLLCRLWGSCTPVIRVEFLQRGSVTSGEPVPQRESPVADEQATQGTTHTDPAEPGQVNDKGDFVEAHGALPEQAAGRVSVPVSANASGDSEGDGGCEEASLPPRLRVYREGPDDRASGAVERRTIWEDIAAHNIGLRQQAARLDAERRPRMKA